MKHSFLPLLVSVLFIGLNCAKESPNKSDDPPTDTLSKIVARNLTILPAGITENLTYTRDLQGRCVKVESQNIQISYEYLQGQVRRVDVNKIQVDTTVRLYILDNGWEKERWLVNLDGSTQIEASFERNPDNTVKKELIYNTAGLSTYNEHEYDTQGNRIRTKTYSAIGTLIFSYESEMDYTLQNSINAENYGLFFTGHSNPNLLKNRYWYDSDGTLRETRTYSYEISLGGLVRESRIVIDKVNGNDTEERTQYIYSK
jgi:hypothetical protein